MCRFLSERFIKIHPGRRGRVPHETLAVDDEEDPERREPLAGRGQVHIWMLLLATCSSCSSLVHSSTSSADGETHSELDDFTKICFFSCSTLKAKAEPRSYACLYVHVSVRARVY